MILDHITLFVEFYPLLLIAHMDVCMPLLLCKHDAIIRQLHVFIHPEPFKNGESANRWGSLPANQLTTYCKAGSISRMLSLTFRPLLCSQPPIQLPQVNQEAGLPCTGPTPGRHKAIKAWVVPTTTGANNFNPRFSFAIKNLGVAYVHSQ